MENEIKDDLEVLKDQEGENLNQEKNLENQGEEVDEENITISKKEFQTLQAQKEHWRRKAQEKNDNSSKENKELTPKNDSLSQSDLIAILKADVSEEDISEVADYAKLKGISVAEALKTSVVKTILNEKQEERKTANVTSTGNARRGSTRKTPSQLLEDSAKGILPDSDEDLATLVAARKGLK